MAGKSQRSPGSLAPIDHEVLGAYREILAETSAEPIMIRQLQGRLPGIPLAALSTILEKLSRLGKLAVQKDGRLVSAIFSSSDALGRLMAQQQGAILSSGKTGSFTIVGVTRQPTEPCEHAAAIWAEYDKLVAELREVNSQLQEARRQNEELARDARKATNKQRKAADELARANEVKEQAERKSAAIASEVRVLRRQVEELQEQAELVASLKERIKELEARESVSGPLADRIIPFFA